MKQDRSFFQRTLSTMVVTNFLFKDRSNLYLRNGKREKRSSPPQNVIRGASFSMENSDLNGRLGNQFSTIDVNVKTFSKRHHFAELSVGIACTQYGVTNGG